MNSNVNNNEEVPTALEDGSILSTDASETEIETIASFIAELGIEGDEEPEICSDEVFEQRIELLALEIAIQQEAKKKNRLLQQVRYTEDYIEFLHQERQQAAAVFLDENSIRNDENENPDHNNNNNNNNDDVTISESRTQLQTIDTILHHHRKTKLDLLREIQTVDALLGVLHQKCREATTVSRSEISSDRKSTPVQSQSRITKPNRS